MYLPCKQSSTKKKKTCGSFMMFERGKKGLGKSDSKTVHSFSHSKPRSCSDIDHPNDGPHFLSHTVTELFFYQVSNVKKRLKNKN